MSNSAFTPQAFQDFRDASVSQSGLVNTVAQSFAGNKTWQGIQTFGPTSGATAHLAYGGIKIWESASAKGGAIHGVAVNGTYNGTHILSNIDGTSFSNSQSNNAVPSWALDLGGTETPVYGSQDTLSIARRAAGSGTINRYLRLDNVGALTQTGLQGALTKLANGLSLAPNTNAVLETNTSLSSAGAFLLAVGIRSGAATVGAFGLIAIHAHIAGGNAVSVISNANLGAGAIVEAGTSGTGTVNNVFFRISNEAGGSYTLRVYNNSATVTYNIGYNILAYSN
jgi:hypothetical protein